MLKYDVSGTDHDKNSSGGWVQPKPNSVLVCKIHEATATNSSNGNPMLKVVYEVVEKDPSKGFRGYDNIPFIESTKWKVDQFLQAVGVDTRSKQSGTLDPKSVVGKLVKVRFKDESYTRTVDGEAVTEVRSKPGGVFRYNGADPDPGPFDSDEEFDTEVTEEVDLTDLATQADEGDEDAMNAIVLHIEENGLEIDPDQFGTWVEVAEAIAAGLETEDEGDTLDYSQWSLEDLRAELQARGLNKTGVRAALVARLEKHDAENPLGD